MKEKKRDAHAVNLSLAGVCRRYNPRAVARHTMRQAEFQSASVLQTAFQSRRDVCAYINTRAHATWVTFGSLLLSILRTRQFPAEAPIENPARARALPDKSWLH